MFVPVLSIHFLRPLPSLKRLPFFFAIGSVVYFFFRPSRRTYVSPSFFLLIFFPMTVHRHLLYESSHFPRGDFFGRFVFPGQPFEGEPFCVLLIFSQSSRGSRFKASDALSYSYSERLLPEITPLSFFSDATHLQAFFVECPSSGALPPRVFFLFYFRRSAGPTRAFPSRLLFPLYVVVCFFDGTLRDVAPVAIET